jgi:hypothetical protein
LLYNENDGLEGLIRRIDLTGLDRRRIYRAVLGRSPENIALCQTPDGYRPDAHLLEALRCQEFQRELIKLLLRAFPERRRIIFIHLPKCAGTDLISKIVGKCPSINNTLCHELWTDKPHLFAALKRIVSEIYCSSAVFVYGHVGLPWLMRQDLIRHHDDCFTIIRDPDEIVLSHVNYVVTRIFADDAVTAPDVQQWLSMLNLKEPPVRPSAQQARDLARSLLWHEEMTRPNTMCRQLGTSPANAEPSATSAINNLIISNIEITDTTRYDRWSQKKFGVTQVTRKNKSEVILTPENLSAKDKEYIARITADDRKLYDCVMHSLNKTESLSIRGGDLNEG